MDDKNLSLNNFFIYEKLNRNSLKRSDSTWIKNNLCGNEAFIIPVYKQKFLISKEGSGEVAFFRPELFSSILNRQDNFIYLGEVEGENYFCVKMNEEDIKKNSLAAYGEFMELRGIAPLLSRKDAALLAYARAMIIWHDNNRYCGVCGSSTVSGEAGHKLICSNKECGTEHFPRTDPAIIVLVSIGDKCLLARQAKWVPRQYATIAGFVEPGESLEQAVAREVHEETGVELDKIRYLSSQPWPFPSAIMLGFRATAKSMNITLHDNELEDARWFTRKEIISGLKENSLKLPFNVSISFRLVESWFNEGSEGNLSDIISSIAK